MSLLLRMWRRLRTMKTAIILLLLLAAAASIGSFVPQRPINELAVLRWKASHASYAQIAEHLGLFDVYGSAWFTAIYGLLLVSLVGCLIPRIRSFVSVLRSRPSPRSALDEFSNFRAGVSPMTPADAADEAVRVLRRRHFRIERDGTSIAAERGHWREGGSLAFHVAFLVLLVGVMLSKGYGVTGQTAVVEGQRFTDTHIGYDSVREGRFFNENHQGFSIQVDRFDVSWYPNFVPRDFVSHVTVLEGEKIVRTDRVRVNHPIDYHGVTVYQLAWGWAPHIQVYQRGKLISDANVVFLQDKTSGNWRGVVKVPSTSPQTALELFFFNDLELTKDSTPFNASPDARHPFIFYQEYRGDLGLTKPQSVYEIDKTLLAPGKVGGLLMGNTAKLDDGIEIRFPDLKKYSVLQFTRNPGAWVLFAASVLILVGLIPALYSSRRRVWVRAIALGDSARIEVAGHALQRRHAFEDEFAAIVRQLAKSLRVEQPAPSRGRVESGIDAS